MSAGVEDRSSRDVRSGTGLAHGHPRHATARTPHRIPTSPVTAVPAQPDPPAADPAPADLNGAEPNAAEPNGTDPHRDGSRDPSDPASADVTGDGDAGSAEKHHHHVLIESNEDRWAWRRRIRQNPHQLRIYRVGVGIAGLLLLCLGLVTGPLPGPGGIPLVLLGLAIWSSEFEWAYRLRQRFKAEIKRFRAWPTSRKVAFWLIFFVVCAGFGYTYLVVLGPPFWMPDVGANLLEHLPGVETG
jgi:uncharacterized protein (TIGR02611 family)